MEISIQQCIAASIAAYEYNGDGVKGSLVTSRDQYCFGNSSLALVALGILKPEDFIMQPPVLEITTEMLTKALQYKDIIQDNYMISILSNKKMSSWNKSVYEILSMNALDVQTVKTRINLLIYLPNTAKALLEKQARIDKLNNLTSTHQGVPGQKIILTCRVLQCFYMANYNTNLTKAIDSLGNLYVWYGLQLFKEDKTLNITAKVKKHGQDYDSGVNCTHLNFVRVKNAE